MSSPPEEARGKKALSRSEVDAKFKSRGVLPIMIREATGVDKLEVSKLRALLAFFEEAHDRNWDVANGPWAHAVEIYLVFFKATLPAIEVGAREVLIKDFLKRCWSIVCGRDCGQAEPTLAIDASASSDQVLTEGAAPTTEAKKVSLGLAAVAKQPPDPEAANEAAYSASFLLLA